MENLVKGLIVAVHFSATTLSGIFALVSNFGQVASDDIGVRIVSLAVFLSLLVAHRPLDKFLGLK